MLKEMFHVLRTYLISFQIFRKRTARFFWWILLFTFIIIFFDISSVIHTLSYII